MKKFISYIATVFSACAILGVSTLSAQVHHAIVANVPFDFTVMDKHFSAGAYTITSETPQGPVLIQGEHSGTAMFVLAFSTQANKVQEEAKLVFNLYGDRYFLHKIWYPGTEQGRELQISKVEQEVARNMPKPGETVVLVAGSKQRSIR